LHHGEGEVGEGEALGEEVEVGEGEEGGVGFLDVGWEFCFEVRRRRDGKGWMLDLPLVWRNCRRAEKCIGRMAVEAQAGTTTGRPCVGFSTLVKVLYGEAKQV
jgi:hypothetical protein